MDDAEAMTEPRAHGGLTLVHVDLLLFAVMLLIAGVALACGPKGLAVVPGVHGRASAAAAGGAAMLPPTPVPAVEPVKFIDMTPDQARDYNASIPFADEHIQPARPLLYQGGPADRENALTCLASAVWYEAGDDKIGEQAVAQVVLNRARHPAFPKTVCGVVFEGSERKTGCQFTFSCDGSLVRVPPADQWARARAIADKALSGFVFKPVGTATHYHTDWVVPYWASSLDKLTEIHTHIFYRWTGWWGTPPAFSGTITQPEVIDPRIVSLSQPAAVAGAIENGVPLPAPGSPAPGVAAAPRIDGVSEADLKGNIVRLADPEHGLFILQLDPHAYPGSYAIVALTICRTRDVCRVFGWFPSPSLPTALPVDEAKTKSATFRYQKSGADELALWDCRVVPRAIDSQCLPGTGSDREGNPAAKIPPKTP